MTHRIINPWTWQEAQGWSWAMETGGAEHVLYLAGHVATDEQGRVMHVGDMRGQIRSVLDNLETTLSEAGYALSDLVRLDYYTTDPDALMANWDVIAKRLGEARSRAGVFSSASLAWRYPSR